MRFLDIARDAQEAFEKTLRTAPAFLHLNDADRKTLAGTKRHTGTGAAVHQSVSAPPTQSAVNSASPQSIQPQRVTIPPTAPTGPGGTNTSAPSTNIRARAPIQPDPRHIYLCVQAGGDNNYKLKAIRSDQFQRDGEFFAELQTQYLKIRGRWRSVFSWWRYDHCEFYRVSHDL